MNSVSDACWPLVSNGLKQDVEVSYFRGRAGYLLEVFLERGLYGCVKIEVDGYSVIIFSVSISSWYFVIPLDSTLDQDVLSDRRP